MDELYSPPSVNDTLWKTFDVPIMRQNVSVAQERFRMLVVVVGLFLNTLVVLVVSGSRQLRYPRHVFWAAISLFECLFLAECVLELAVIVYKNQSACRMFVLLASVDYSILLVCLSLAAFDRYLSIVRYEWYKKSVTVRGVVWLLSLASLLTFVIVTGPFWTGYLSIHTCTVNLAHVYYVFAWDLCLGILCVILHFKIFVESKNLIRQYKSSYRREPMTVRFINHSTIRASITDLAEGPTLTMDDTSHSAKRVFVDYAGNNSSVAVRNKNTGGPIASFAAQENIDSTECFPWTIQRHHSNNVNRLEVRAALSMSVNVLPFWLCTFPVSVHAIAMYWCIRLEGDCAVVLSVGSFVRDFFLFHSIYNPIMYMSTSSEFRRSLLHIAWKLKNKLFVLLHSIR